MSSTQHALSNREADELSKKVKAAALVKCDDVVREFAACASGRTVSVAWACRDLHKKMQDCLRPQYVAPLSLCARDFAERSADLLALMGFLLSTDAEAMERARIAYLAEKRAR
ncbi:hypothetical protein OC835_002958 [Tilletia horrida]|nr:hypothetical protein OC835_002958 [Tilletia horrida]